MPATTALSDAAQALLRRRLAGERVEVTDESRPLYRELVAAGLMEPLHTFALDLKAPTGSREPLALYGKSDRARKGFAVARGVILGESRSPLTQ